MKVSLKKELDKYFTDPNYRSRVHRRFTYKNKPTAKDKLISTFYDQLSSIPGSEMFTAISARPSGGFLLMSWNQFVDLFNKFLEDYNKEEK